jgi:hypothetical protein
MNDRGYISPKGYIFNCVKITWNGTFYAIMSNQLEAESLVLMVTDQLKRNGLPIAKLPTLMIMPHYNPEFDDRKELNRQDN